MKKISVSRSELLEYANDHVGFVHLDLSRISTVFIAQIFQLERSRSVNTYRILDEVKYLEGLAPATCTGKAEQFKKEPLKGLMKKHFTDASFIMKNIASHYGLDKGGNRNLDKAIEKSFNRAKSDIADEDFIKYLSHILSIWAYEQRAKSRALTGEWFIFKNHNGKNYYLTVASHRENDEEIYKRVCMAYDLDFDFLRENGLN